MEKTLKVVELIGSADLQISNGKIKQTVRNDLKAQLVSALAEDLNGAGVDALVTLDGIAVPIENGKNLVTFTINPVAKPLSYDPDLAREEYEDKMAERIKREEERLAKKKAKEQKA